MKEAEHVYTAPATSSGIPDGVVRYLDGTELLTKTQALRLSTVGSDGWPHAALLSAGDIVIMPSGRVRFAIFPQSPWRPILNEKDGSRSRFHSMAAFAR
ncbi:hypothetical protein AAFX91_05805 [Bradyrhizobium sp. 31Argb]|uniref:hypothetical protein n=1 Tax=Bradyrhizobium sp. 31Argb TaxID=3141247 RepID=UPI003748C4DF